jgi:hypothetical protein
MVSASGTAPLGYQWVFDATNAVGTSTNVLTVSNAQVNQTGTYCVVISNSAGSITSAVATLTVGVPPSIVQQPSGSVIVQGQGAILSVSAVGDVPLTYQWRFDGTPLNAGTGSTFTIAPASTSDAGDYDVVVNNLYGSITSAVARLTVLVPPSITSQPASQSVVAGVSASLQVIASGTDPLSYQWLFNETNVVGSNTNVLTFAPAQTTQAGDYSVVVRNVAGAVTSAVAQVMILVPPSILAEPTNTTAVLGGNAGFSVSAAGSAALSYQWSFNGSDIPGATSASLALPNVRAAQAGTYAVVITNAVGSATSSGATLNVLVPPSLLTSAAIGTSFSVSVPSLSGLSYLLEFKNALLDPSWTPVSSWVPGTGGPLILQDTNTLSGARFYRVAVH